MKAMVIARTGPVRPGVAPLEAMDLPVPQPGPRDLLVRVMACGVCRTELDEVEGRAPPASLPMVPGHQAVGRVEAAGADVTGVSPGDRVGVAWIYSSCGDCGYCKRGQENLCPSFRATGRDAPGGYAEYLCVPEGSAYHLPAGLDDVSVAPLLCAGAVGYRALRLAEMEDGQALGLVGFGASAHLVLQAAKHLYPRSPVYVFTRRAEEQQFARDLGAEWAGGIDEPPPRPLDRAIDTTPAWGPMMRGLRHLAPGGRLVVNAIRKEEADKQALLDLSYADDLWREKELKTVANVTPADVREFLALAPAAGIRPTVETYPLARADDALQDLRAGRIRGAKVLLVGE